MRGAKWLWIPSSSRVWPGRESYATKTMRRRIPTTTATMTNDCRSGGGRISLSKGV